MGLVGGALVAERDGDGEGLEAPPEGTVVGVDGAEFGGFLRTVVWGGILGGDGLLGGADHLEIGKVVG